MLSHVTLLEDHESGGGRHRVLRGLANLGDGSRVPAATRAEQSVMLEASDADQVLAFSRLELDVAVLVDVVPRCLLRNVRKLHREAQRSERGDERLDALGVVIPPSSVHVRAVLECDYGRVLVVALVERVESVVLGGGARVVRGAHELGRGKQARGERRAPCRGQRWTGLVRTRRGNK